MNPMTDKITYGTCCSYPTEGGDPYCFSVYHSCANIRILGTQDPATYIANHQNPPGGPYMRESAVSDSGLDVIIPVIMNWNHILEIRLCVFAKLCCSNGPISMEDTG